jgi:hypothetical protein
MIMQLPNNAQIRVSINGRAYFLRADLPASEVKQLVGINPRRQLLAQHQDGSLELVYDNQPLPSAQLIDVPAFIWG